MENLGTTEPKCPSLTRIPKAKDMSACLNSASESAASNLPKSDDETSQHGSRVSGDVDQDISNSKQDYIDYENFEVTKDVCPGLLQKQTSESNQCWGEILDSSQHRNPDDT